METEHIIREEVIQTQEKRGKTRILKYGNKGENGKEGKKEGFESRETWGKLTKSGGNRENHFLLLLKKMHK